MDFAVHVDMVCRGNSIGKGMKMIGECDIDGIIGQSAFCMMLMSKLHAEIEKSGVGSWSGMENHCRKQDDIKRIRRELLTLSKMLNPW